jgi:hypothetical protein
VTLTILTTAVSLFVGWWVSQYFFRRSTSKSLGVYGLFNSFVFSGIASDVRKQLHFHFNEREVVELQHIAFLVANDGERAIREPLEPLTLPISSNAELLDATIIHRFPSELKVDIHIVPSEVSCEKIALIFPLLNKGEFFVVKLLINGNLPFADVLFSIQAEDLPRTLGVKPPPSTQKSKSFLDWGMAALAVVLWAWTVWLGYFAKLLYHQRIDLFPYPWDTFRFSLESTFFFIVGIAALGFFVVVAIAATVTSMIGGDFGFSKRPIFQLPPELSESILAFNFTAGTSLKPLAILSTGEPQKPSDGSV